MNRTKRATVTIEIEFNGSEYDEDDLLDRIVANVAELCDVEDYAIAVEQCAHSWTEYDICRKCGKVDDE